MVSSFVLLVHRRVMLLCKVRFDLALLIRVRRLMDGNGCCLWMDGEMLVLR